jgi:flavin reductase (DIM6/NTAB) family NADH-FMN oxidoreductase RutF
VAEPGGTGPIGPFPPSVTGPDAEADYDKARRRLLWTFPSGLFVVGSRSGDRRNGMTANWCMQVSFDPKLVAVSIEKGALTHELIADGGVFSVNLVSREDRAIVRKFTKPVEVVIGADTMTFNGFPFHEGVTGAPILTQAVGYVDCALRQSIDVGGHTLFVGEVMNCAFQGTEDTPVLRMEDTRMNYGG